MSLDNDTPSKKSKKTKTKSAAGSAVLAFIAVCGIGIFGGIGVGQYAEYRKGSSLSADYAHAAICKEKQARQEECSFLEHTSVIKVEANESLQDTSYNIAIGLGVMGFLGLSGS